MSDHERRLAGRVICTGIPGPQLDATTREALTQLQPSGIILFRRNYESVEQLYELIAALHALPSAPLLCIDHEGGAVVRLPEPFTQFPPARSIALAGDPKLAYAVGKAMGIELASVGIDVDFAPVLDVDSNPRNPVIGERAFGETAEAVTAFAVQLMHGLHAGGVIACGKHFPGHGDTDRDSHLELPIVRRRQVEMDTVELAPFRAAIDADIGVLMTAHVLYTGLDERHPATFSRRILNHLLRLQLRYEGVIITDDLAMGAVSASASIPEAAVRALEAGADWILVGNDIEASMQAAEAVAAALSSGALDRRRIEAAAGRVRRIAPSRRTEPLALPVFRHQDLDEHIRSIVDRFTLAT